MVNMLGFMVDPTYKFAFQKGGRLVMRINAIMKTATIGLLAAFTSFASHGAAIVDSYDFTMRLNVPRIYDNMQSKGYRKYQPQTLKGTLLLIYPDSSEPIVKVNGLRNLTHRIGGKMVTYECYEWPYDDNAVLTVGIGSNKTGKFNQGGAAFSFVAEPSYNIGDIDEDNTLMLELSGHGILRKDVLKTLKGVVRGRIGCGCMAYGHISPTRLFLGYLTTIVWDVAPLDGTFTAKFKERSVSDEYR